MNKYLDYISKKYDSEILLFFKNLGFKIDLTKDNEITRSDEQIELICPNNRTITRYIVNAFGIKAYENSTLVINQFFIKNNCDFIAAQEAKFGKHYLSDLKNYKKNRTDNSVLTY